MNTAACDAVLAEAQSLEYRVAWVPEAIQPRHRRMLDKPDAARLAVDAVFIDG